MVQRPVGVLDFSGHPCLGQALFTPRFVGNGQLLLWTVVWRAGGLFWQTLEVPAGSQWTRSVPQCTAAFQPSTRHNRQHLSLHNFNFASLHHSRHGCCADSNQRATTIALLFWMVVRVVNYESPDNNLRKHKVA